MMDPPGPVPDLATRLRPDLSTMTHRRVRSRARLLVPGTLLLALAAPACFNINQPSRAQGSGQGVVLLESVEWGRLVSVADTTGRVVARDVLIRGDLKEDGINYLLSTSPVTQEEVLTILQPEGSSGFRTLLAAARSGLDSVDVKGPSDPPPYPVVPRNAAIRLTFSEQVAPSSVDATTIQVLTGDPPAVAMSVRLVVQNDPASGKGHVILDPTISARQSAELGLPQNAVGYPASFNLTDDNLQIRIPTEVNTGFGQPRVLTNLAGTRHIAVGPEDPTVPDLAGKPMVVRSIRTGSEADEFRGFLPDFHRPSIITRKDVTVDTIRPSAPGEPGEFQVIYSVQERFCQQLTPKVGDVLEVGDALAAITAFVVRDPGGLGTEWVQVGASLLDGAMPATGSGLGLTGRLTTRYTAVEADYQTCFLEFTPFSEPAPGQAIALDPFATFRVRFDEPVEPLSVLSMHSLVLVAIDENAAPGDPTAPFDPTTETVADFIDRQRGYHNPVSGSSREYGGRILFGPIEVGTDSSTFTLAPIAGLTDPDSDDQQYYTLAIRDGVDGIVDLAGNPLATSGFAAGPAPGAGKDPEQSITVLPDINNHTLKDRYFCLRGLGVDEDGDGLPEYAGQYDVLPGAITGRVPERFSRQADGNTESIGAGLALGFANAPFEPLTPAGAVVMTVYRPHDFGFSYEDPNEYNLDVEGFNWAPLGGVVNDDSFPIFSLALAHANTMPDEQPNPFSPNIPLYPNSGLLTGSPFDDNILGFPTFDEKIVFETQYDLRSVNLFVSESGTTMLPYPTFTETYTWRDTAIPQSFLGGATQSQGSPPSAFGLPIWGPEKVPSVGLPLLVRLRCWPRGNFIGTNQYQVSNLFPTGIGTTTAPAFRVFSAGGVDSGNVFRPVIPDNSAFGGTSPTGGFLNGVRTSNHDQVVYWAQGDFVVRVSRVWTHWFDMGVPIASATDIRGTLLEPANVVQAPGTEVIVEYRGSAAVQHPTDPTTTPSPLTDARRPFDEYGDFIGAFGGSVSTPGDWSADVEEALVNQTQAYQFFQLRFTFVSDADAGLRAVLDGFGLAWRF